MTADERQTTQYLAFLFSSYASTNQKEQKFWQNQAKKIWDEKIESLLKDGEKAFLIKVRERIKNDNGDKPFNLCPNCSI